MAYVGANFLETRTIPLGAMDLYHNQNPHFFFNAAICREVTGNTLPCLRFGGH